MPSEGVQTPRACGMRHKKKLKESASSANIPAVRHRDDYTDRAWRKSRLAARILLRKAAGRMTARDRRLATILAVDGEVTNRLIQQGLYFLGVGNRKHVLDRSLGLVDRRG